MEEKSENVEKYYKKYSNDYRSKRNSDKKNKEHKRKHEEKKEYKNFGSKEVTLKNYKSSEEVDYLHNNMKSKKKKYKEDSMEEISSKSDYISYSSSRKNYDYDKFIRNKNSDEKKYFVRRKYPKNGKIKEDDIDNISFNKSKQKDKDKFKEKKHDKNENSFIKEKKRKLSTNYKKETHANNEKLKKKLNIKRRKINHDRELSENNFTSTSSSNEKSYSTSYSSNESISSNSSCDTNKNNSSSYISNVSSNKSSLSNSLSKEDDSKKKKKYITKYEIDKKEVYDAHIYDSKEMIRLTINILQNYNFLNNLKVLYQKLDKKKKISIEGVKDLKLKKKLRHLFRAWKLEKKEEFYRKPSNFKESIFEIFNNLLYFFLSKIDLQKLKENINKRKSNLIDKDGKKSHIIADEEDTSSDLHAKNKNINYNSQSLTELQEDYLHLMQNARDQIKSLREMHDEGYFKHSQQKYKEFMEKHKKIDLWGKNEQEQKYLMNYKNRSNERKTFDRETDLCINKFVKKEDYKNLIKNTREHVNDKFHKTGNKT